MKRTSLSIPVSLLLLLLAHHSGAASGSSRKEISRVLASTESTAPRHLEQASTQLIFPQIANGTTPGLQIETLILLLHPGGQSATATLRFFGSDGSPLSLTIFDVAGEEEVALGTGSELSVGVPAGALTILATDGEGPVVAGWMQVDAGVPLNGWVLFSLRDDVSFKLQTEVGVGATPASTDFLMPAVRLTEEESIQTSVAICNTSDQTAHLQATLTGNEGTVLVKTISLLPKQHYARFLEEIFTEIESTEFVGFVRFVRVDAQGSPSSQLDVHAIALVTDEGILTSVPVSEPAP